MVGLCPLLCAALPAPAKPEPSPAGLPTTQQSVSRTIPCVQAHKVPFFLESAQLRTQREVTETLMDFVARTHRKQDFPSPSYGQGSGDQTVTALQEQAADYVDGS